MPEELKIKGEVVRVKGCDVEPAEIMWENMHIKKRSRIARFLIQCILVLTIMAIGFIVISVINISTPPTSYASSYESTDIENLTL